MRANVWPGFSFLVDRVGDTGAIRGDGYGCGRIRNRVDDLPSQDLTVVVLTQRAVDQTGLPLSGDLLVAARAAG